VYALSAAQFWESHGSGSGQGSDRNRRGVGVDFAIARAFAVDRNRHTRCDNLAALEAIGRAVPMGRFLCQKLDMKLANRAKHIVA
jgi:hypothetical protein